MHLKNTICLIGFPGVGKYTIAKEIAKLTGARLIDNHSLTNPIYNVVDVDFKTGFPDTFGHRVHQIEAAVFEAISTLSPPEWSFISTNYLANGEDAQVEFYQRRDLAKWRRGTFVPVRLLCNLEETERRIVSANRKERHKDTSIERARLRYATETVFQTDHPNALTLEISDLSACKAAQQIVQHAGRVLSLLDR